MNGSALAERVKLKGARTLGRVLSAKQASTLTKFIFLQEVLRHHQVDLILDVGANVGQFARAMRDIGFRGDIVSFEPVASEFDKLRLAAAGDAKWRTCNYALGDASDKRPMNVMASSVFSSFNAPSVAETAAFVGGNTVVRTEEVQIRRLDDVVTELNLSDRLERCLLKCDTQGFDLQVLKGAGDVLARVRLLLLEVGVTRIYDGAPSMDEMLTFLTEHRFAPVNFFPISRLPDWSAAEFDYLGVRRDD